MSKEYFAVILEFNCQEVKLGFAHEPKEHVCIVPGHPLWDRYIMLENRDHVPSYLEFFSPCVDLELRKLLQSNAENDPKLSKMLLQYSSDGKNLEWYDWEADRFMALARLIRHLISSSLLISPSSSKLFLVDTGLSAVSKRNFCDAVFEQQASASVSFLSHSLCSSMASGVRDALVVDLGWKSCKMSSVVDLRIVDCSESIEVSREASHYKYVLNSEFKGFGAVEKQLWGASDPNALHSFSLQLLPQMIAHIIKKSSLETRRRLAEHIIFTGKLSNCHLLLELILSEVSQHLHTIRASALENLGSWAGASVYCSTVLLKEEYEDWKNMQISYGQSDQEVASELERWHR